MRTTSHQTPSPWPSLRKRSRALVTEVYAEVVSDTVSLFNRALTDPPPPGPPSLRSRLQNLLLSSVAVFVACIGGVERLLLGANGMPVNEVRAATLQEVQRGAGNLDDRKLLASAYEVWIGNRPEGYLRLRYMYDVERLVTLLEGAAAGDAAGDAPPPRRVCEPLDLDKETSDWVRAHVSKPCAASRLAVWRALKRRLYHYDAGVVAFRGFPRNYLLSKAQWAALMEGGRTGPDTLALDIGSGDGSLNQPMRGLVGRLVGTELTVPLVVRLRSEGLDAQVADVPSPSALGVAPASFDWVLILNVLDRCKDPFDMLLQAQRNMKPDGRLIVSVVLPASQSDAAATVGSTQRRWSVQGRDFESAACSLLRDLLLPAGFVAERLVRAPYLCAGDRYSPVAALDACMVVLRLADPAVRAHANAAAALAAAPTVCDECDDARATAATPLLRGAKAHMA